MSEPPKKKIRASRFRNFCFTSFEEKKKWEDFFKENDALVRYICVGQETCPKTKKLHWQGWLQTNNPTSLKSMIKLMKPDHVEICKGDITSNELYTQKEGKFEKFGTLQTQGARNDLKGIRMAIDEGKSMLDVAQMNFGSFVRYNKGFEKYQFMVRQKAARTFRKLETFVYWGDSGTGKTRKAFEENPDALIMHGTIMKKNWWDGYDFNKTLIIDEYDSQVPITHMLQILDGYPMRLATKGGHTWAAWTKVIITSNVEPKLWHKNAKPEHRAALKRRLTQITKFSKSATK